MQELKEVFQETKDANTWATIGLKECIGQSKKEYAIEHQLEPVTQYWDNASIDDNKEEEEFQGQLMAERHYMIDEDESGNSYHEHVQATTNFERELNYLPEDEVFECCPTTHIYDLKMRIHQLKAARTIYVRVMEKFKPCLFCDYCYNPTHHQSKCPFILHYLVDEDEIVDNEEEHTKQVEHAQVTTTL